MRHKFFHIHYAHNGETFLKSFSPADFTEVAALGFPGILRFKTEDGMPQIAALALVNEWNKRNGDLGFTYWLSEQQ